MRFFLALFFAWGVLAGTGPEAPDSSSTTSALEMAPYQFAQGSEMTIHGSSNVRDWRMEVAEVNGEVDLEPSEEGAPTINSVSLEIPVEQIVADRGSMEDKAHKALKKNAYPIIYFQSSDVEVSPGEGARAQAGEESSSEARVSEGTAFTATATGEMILAGERRTVEITATGTRLEDGRYRLEGEHEMTMSEFNVDPPTAMLGTLRVTDEVRLTFNAILAPK